MGCFYWRSLFLPKCNILFAESEFCSCRIIWFYLSNQGFYSPNHGFSLPNQWFYLPNHGLTGSRRSGTIWSSQSKRREEKRSCHTTLDRTPDGSIDANCLFKTLNYSAVTTKRIITTNTISIHTPISTLFHRLLEQKRLLRYEDPWEVAESFCSWHQLHNSKKEIIRRSWEAIDVFSCWLFVCQRVWDQFYKGEYLQ